jgi:hypothetical protein
MPRMKAPGGTVVEIGDGPLARNLRAAGWTDEDDQPKPEPAKKTAPRRRRGRTTQD